MLLPAGPKSPRISLNSSTTSSTAAAKIPAMMAMERLSRRGGSSSSGSRRTSPVCFFTAEATCAVGMGMVGSLSAAGLDSSCRM